MSLKRSVPVWTTPLPPAVRWLTLAGPFLGEQRSPTKRCRAGQRLQLRLRCAAPVAVTVEYRVQGRWLAGETLTEEADATLTFAPMASTTLRLCVVSLVETPGIVELVEA